MNAILLVTTVIAVAVAIAAVIALFVAFREERRRSDARVAALREMAGPINPADEIVVGPIDIADLAAYDALLPPDQPPLELRRSAEALAKAEGGSHASSGGSQTSSRAMFSDDGASSPWGRRIAAAAAMAAIVIAAGYVLLPGDRSITGEGHSAPLVKQAPPLELLSLRHSQEDGRLVITGLVQNPRAGAPLTRVIATAFLFGADGTFLASGRAPLDFSTLAAGDESPFVLTVPVASVVARYRVGFRGEDGRVIAHVDRRATGTLARTGQ